MPLSTEDLNRVRRSVRAVLGVVGASLIAVPGLIAVLIYVWRNYAAALWVYALGPSVLSLVAAYFISCSVRSWTVRVGAWVLAALLLVKAALILRAGPASSWLFLDAAVTVALAGVATGYLEAIGALRPGRLLVARRWVADAAAVCAAAAAMIIVLVLLIDSARQDFALNPEGGLLLTRGVILVAGWVLLWKRCRTLARAVAAGGPECS